LGRDAAQGTNGIGVMFEDVEAGSGGERRDRGGEVLEKAREMVEVKGVTEVVAVAAVGFERSDTEPETLEEEGKFAAARADVEPAGGSGRKVGEEPTNSDTGGFGGTDNVVGFWTEDSLVFQSVALEVVAAKVVNVRNRVDSE